LRHLLAMARHAPDGYRLYYMTVTPLSLCHWQAVSEVAETVLHSSGTAGQGSSCRSLSDS